MCPLLAAKNISFRLSVKVKEVVRDTTVVSRSSRYSGHVTADTTVDRFFYLPTKDLAPFSIHIPTKKPSFTLINDFVVKKANFGGDLPGDLPGAAAPAPRNK